VPGGGGEVFGRSLLPALGPTIRGGGGEISEGREAPERDGTLPPVVWIDGCEIAGGPARLGFASIRSTTITAAMVATAPATKPNAHAGQRICQAAAFGTR